MNKEQALRFGVRDDCYKEFQKQYNTDLNKRVQYSVERALKTPKTAELHNAIKTMVFLIDDVNMLNIILNNVNRHYCNYAQRMETVKAASTSSAPVMAANRHFSMPDQTEQIEKEEHTEQESAQDRGKESQEKQEQNEQQEREEEGACARVDQD